MKILSIIVPVYKVEQYIQTCLESIINQPIDPNQYEIIVVDDGSPDNSASIVKKMMVAHPNIQLIHQENQGLSIARNTGLKHAQGRYVQFVDSDDYLLPDTLDKLIPAIQNMNVPVLRFEAEWEEFRQRGKCHLSGIISWKEALMSDDYEACVPLYMFYRQWLIENHLTFYPHIYHEDSEFTPRTIYLAQAIGMQRTTVYHVRKNETSITHNTNTKRAFDCITICQNNHNFFSSQCKPIDPIISKFIAIDLNTAFTIIQQANSAEQERFNKLLYDNKYLFKHFWSTKLFKYRLEGLWLNLFLKHIVFGFTILSKFYN